MSALIGRSLTATDVLRERLRGFRYTTGGQATAHCPRPEHADNSPSFRVNVTPSSPRYLQWYCNGCGSRGNGRGLLRILLGKDQDAIIDALLPKLKVQPSPQARTQLPPQQHLPEALLALFQDYTLSELLAAGFTPQTLRENGVGWDPHRECLTYPIRDLDGGLVGIYRRRKDGEEGAKYLPYGVRDYPAGLIDPGYVFHKGQVLWRQHLEMQRPARDYTVVVEGFKAAMWVGQEVDDAHVVASLGMSLSPRQIQLLSFLPSPYVVLYDNNRNAIEQAAKVAATLRQAGLPAVGVRRYSLPDAPQPDDLPRGELRSTLCRS